MTLTLCILFRFSFTHVMMAPTLNVDESDASMRQRLVNSLSQSFPGSALSKALQCMNDSDDDMKDPLSSSCFAELRLEKEEPDEDDELTSLSWLQDSNLLKDINAGEEVEGEMKENGDIKTEFPQTHPCHVPYNPHKHVNSKPPYSFSCLIFMAIEDSPQKKLPVKDIYQWILSHFPYFQNAPTGWKNSVRHNLSLNKCFKKVDKDRGQVIIFLTLSLPAENGSNNKGGRMMHSLLQPSERLPCWQDTGLDKQKKTVENCEYFLTHQF